ncbi:hypothetical protein DFJ67_0962 [Asanoa ferruginea]|uniref:Lipoprotein n=1 Tax=Asanoa ferruginea TaxID=53367 RepID=A0A3D9ZCM0_9ACTN|nr:hypothetical protein [Asanoa ferruginea]REF95015.1 hypothetical protein DFJ67_0962 [Asanoa ferruginea]GIF48827.1 hypothetical protein Afe04nite_33660 [Asanoa ferruginea]
MAERRLSYGAGAPHAVLLLGCFTIAGWAAFFASGQASLWRMGVWFVGSAVAHDWVLFPIYAGVDRLLRRATRADRPDRIAVLNHIRVPALGAALLFLVFLPGILDLRGGTYEAATGQHRVSYAIRWLWVSGALFLLSFVVLAIRRARRR